MPIAASVATPSIAQQLLAEFEAQAPITRRFLASLPSDKLTWRPHPRSMTAGQLALHLASVPGGIALAALNTRNPAPDFNHRQPASIQEVLDAFEQSILTVREQLPTFDDAAMQTAWTVVSGEQVVLSMPREQVFRQIMLNHWYQHRGQFSVYLRLLDRPVPASWGPSADENPFAR